MFSAVEYGRDPNVTHLTTRLRRHCIPVRQKHLSHHSTAGDIRSPPPLAAPSPATTGPRGHITCRHVHFSRHGRLLNRASYHSTCRRWIGTAPWSSRWSQLPAPLFALSVAPAAATADASACCSCRPLTEVCARTSLFSVCPCDVQHSFL